MSGDRTVELLTREDCPLCRRAEGLLHRWATRLDLAVVVTDVDAEPELVAEFGGRVPVVRGADGSILDEGRISERNLVWALARYRWG